jgi:hypothetical protein
MGKHTLLYPSNVAIVKQSKIQDDTYDALNEIIASGYNFELGEEALTLNKGFESFESEVLRAGGMVKVDSHVVRRFATLGITNGSWAHELHALLEGISPTDVAADQTASFAASDDATAVKGIAAPATVYNEEFSILAKCPLRKAADGDLYIYIPKAVVKQDAADQTIRLGAQQKPVVTFEALALQTDEVAKHAALYDGVTANGVAYIFSGKTDA